MSAMKRYAEDVAELIRRAERAAWEPTAPLRMAALRAVFEDCGTAAEVYANPVMVARLLTKAATREFMNQRKATVYRVAG